MRLEAIDGKGMIVCMSRRICVELYDKIIKLRPEWHSEDDGKGEIKVIMTGSASDPPEWQKHIRNKERRSALAERMKDPDDPMKLAIVRDMWLTGFDAPSLHTMYFDKPMRGHGLMQAIARVNRVYMDKPGGLIVDYLGVAQELKNALAHYAGSGGRGRTTIDQEEAVAIMLEKYELVCNLFYRFDYGKFFDASSKRDKMAVLTAAMEHILSQEDGKKRYLKHVTELSKAFALSVPHEDAIRIRDEVGFFQAVRSGISKTTTAHEVVGEDIDTAIRQIVSKAVVAGDIIDIFDAAGLKRPEISMLSDEFLADVKGMHHKHLGLELLKKLLNDEIKIRSKKNLVESRSFSAMLDEVVKKYTVRGIEAAEVIEELIELAKEMREASHRGEELGLSDDELAFYDALEVNDSAVKVLGDETLKVIARELVDTVRRNTTIDWTLREDVQAKLKVMVKRVLRKYGYPPDKQKKATDTVLEQAALISMECATA